MGLPAMASCSVLPMNQGNKTYLPKCISTGTARMGKTGKLGNWKNANYGASNIRAGCMEIEQATL